MPRSVAGFGSGLGGADTTGTVTGGAEIADALVERRRGAVGDVAGAPSVSAGRGRGARLAGAVGVAGEVAGRGARVRETRAGATPFASAASGCRRTFSSVSSIDISVNIPLIHVIGHEFDVGMMSLRREVMRRRNGCEALSHQVERPWQVVGQSHHPHGAWRSSFPKTAWASRQSPHYTFRNDHV